jgi:hypothetical protein
MKTDSIEYLKENIYIWEERKQGVCKHLSELQADRFLKIAKEIDPKVNFQIRECQDCIDSLVKFVFLAWEKAMTKNKV